MFEKILEIIYPRKCAICKSLISEDYTCKKCKKNLEYICINDKIDKVENKYFDFLICSYFYSSIIREKILDFKFKNKKYLYKFLANKLLDNLKKHSNTFDIIIPVPISLKRFFERGYNQSSLIAKFLSKSLNKPVGKFILIKTKNNKKQSILGIKEREANVKNTYQVFNANIISGKNLLLIDDIYTTGATVNECSKILKQNGAKNIIVATIAKAELNKHII